MPLEGDWTKGGEPPTQAGHSLAIETPLGEDALLLTTLDGVETVSRGFVYTVEMLTDAADSDVCGLIGKPVTLWLRHDIAAERRPLHGHVRHLTRLGVDIRGYCRWRAEVAPWLAFLTYSVDCRIYQDLSIPDILRSVFDEHQLSDYEFRLHRQYPKIDFCVQYRESAFAFVSRLMEHVGIFYSFEHYPDRHLLVVGDYSSLAKFTTPQEVTFATRAEIGEIQEFQDNYTFRPGKWALNDFDFESPTKNLHTSERTMLGFEPMKRFEIFDYPGYFLERDKGNDLTRLRIEAEEARHHEIHGAGSCAAFDPGKRFTLSPVRSDRAAMQETYFLTEVRHTASEARYFSATEEAATYSNRFAAIPARTPFRPERLTRKPVVQGPQTATVVGPVGESIYTDQYGRVRVLFHWDRRGKRDEQASCWIRVSQHSAGSHWGSLAIPHVGDEVVIGFLEGDPDRPMVIGRVHNGTNMPPLNLPRDRHKTVIRDHGDNRLIMHGKPGYERMTMVSPKNINIVAMRSAAKPLSAQVIDGVSFDDYEDGASLAELQVVYQQLLQLEGKGGATDTNKVGVYYTSPDGSQTKSQPADEGASIDINTLTEHDLNSLSVGNTNNWVGSNSNSWVNGNSNSQVNGNSTTAINGSSTTQIGNGASTTIHNGNSTFVSGNNTQVITGTNDQAIFGLNTSFIFGGSATAIMPLSVQLFVGVNSQISVGFASQVTLGLAQQYATLNAQCFGVNMQHNGINCSWDDTTVKTASGADMTTAEFMAKYSPLHIFM
ncbi:MAG TPA: type VI secretion system tip protein TssI/VgrG [Acetobacteraceae bacterium]|nr:type VI secretion system tip protein TssI/VgrG [Acetobacteraceae bacterium]